MALIRDQGKPSEHFIQVGRRGKPPKGCTERQVRRYSQEVAIHFAQWADPDLAVELQAALLQFVAGNVTTADSLEASRIFTEALDKGRRNLEGPAASPPPQGANDQAENYPALACKNEQLRIKLHESQHQIQVGLIAQGLCRSISHPLMLQELEERIQNLLPVGPSWKATQNLTLWAKERETALEAATNYASLAFGPPPILYEACKRYDQDQETEEGARPLNGDGGDEYDIYHQ